ncbi:hypothetical protein T4A_4575, partial [Trichinella pseudospiralis]
LHRQMALILIDKRVVYEEKLRALRQCTLTKEKGHNATIFSILQRDQIITDILRIQSKICS